MLEPTLASTNQSLSNSHDIVLCNTHIVDRNGKAALQESGYRETLFIDAPVICTAASQRRSQVTGTAAGAEAPHLCGCPAQVLVGENTASVTYDIASWNLMVAIARARTPVTSTQNLPYLPLGPPARRKGVPIPSGCNFTTASGLSGSIDSKIPPYGPFKPKLSAMIALTGRTRVPIQPQLVSLHRLGGSLRGNRAAQPQR
jgi:hypothetical protein